MNSPWSAGTSLHGWWGETSGDMAFDDESAMVFDSEPLKEPVEIIGLPKVNLVVSADAQQRVPTIHQMVMQFDPIF